MTDTTTFAKVFGLADGRQLVVYQDPISDPPSLVMVSHINGIVMDSRMTLQGSTPAPVESQRMALAHVLGEFDQARAEQIAKLLVDTIRDKAPIINILNEIKEIVDGPQPTFAYLVTGPSGVQALLLTETDDEEPTLRVVTPSHMATVSFPNVWERGMALANMDQLDQALPEELRAELGMSSQRRKPSFAL